MNPDLNTLAIALYTTINDLLAENRLFGDEGGVEDGQVL